MFNIYLYSQDTGAYLGTRRGYLESNYKSAALQFSRDGFSVKVIDTRDGAVIYTLD